MVILFLHCLKITVFALRGKQFAPHLLMERGEVLVEMNPLLCTIPAQLLAYEIACRPGAVTRISRAICAKSVTVE